MKATKPLQMYLHQCWVLLQHPLISLVHRQLRIMGRREVHSDRMRLHLRCRQCRVDLPSVVWAVSQEARIQALIIHRHQAIQPVDYTRLAIKVREIIHLAGIPSPVPLNILLAPQACLPCQAVQGIWVWTQEQARKLLKSLLKRGSLMLSETGSASCE